MADLIRKPGVEITQVVTPTPVTPVVPTLAPCIVGPAFEVMETSEGGLPNSASIVDNISYAQQPLTVPALSFPTNHADIEEVSVAGLTDEISAALFKPDGSSISLNPNDPSAFLDRLPSAHRPAIFFKTVGVADTLRLFSSASSQAVEVSILATDTVPTVVTKLNTLSGFEAYDVSAEPNSDYDVILTIADSARSYGPSASITAVAKNGTVILNHDTHDMRVEGSGVFTEVPSGRSSTSYIKQSGGTFYLGDYSGSATVAASAIADLDAADKAVPGWLPLGWDQTKTVATAQVAALVSTTDFTNYDLQTALPTRHGDLIYADGVELGMVLNVRADSIEVGVVDATNSEYNALGQPTRQVYRRSALTSEFSPNSVYFIAKSLSVKELDGTVNAKIKIDVDANVTSAEPGSITLTAADPANIAVDGTRIIFGVNINGAPAHGDFGFTFNGNVGSYAALVNAINITIQGRGLGFVASEDNGVVIETIEKGASAEIVIRSVADGCTALNAFQQGVGELSDTGSDLVSNNLFDGNSLTIKLDDNPHSFTFDANGAAGTARVLDLIDQINADIGYAFASAALDPSDNKVYVTFESASVGRNSKIEVTAFAPLWAATQSDSGSGRPNPNISVSSAGTVSIGPNIARFAKTGLPIARTDFDVGVSYRGLRLDLSPSANDPGLLQFSSLTELSSLLSPIDTRNPLALGVYYALINAGGDITISAIGVDDVSSSEPEGTALAYQRALEFLEAYEVYAIAPLTHSEQVIESVDSHVTNMSAPEGKKERVLISSPLVPTRRNDIVASSGESALWGNVLNLVDTGDVGLEDAVDSIGMDSTIPIPFALSNGFQPVLSIEIDGEQRKYSIASVSGSTVTVRLTDLSNSDGYYSTIPISTNFTNATYSVFLRGSELTVPGSSTLLDKNALATTVRDRAQQYNNSRQLRLFPQDVQSVINGVEQLIPMYYFASAIAGRTAGLSAETPFSRRSMDGFTNVADYGLTNNQLNIISAGNAIVEVESEGLAPSIRIQSTTSPSALETREYSIIKAVDTFAKTLRGALKDRVGSFNITQTYVDDTTTIVDVICQGSVEQGLLENAVINAIEQDETQPDTLRVEVSVDVLYPANYIKVTILV